MIAGSTNTTATSGVELLFDLEADPYEMNNLAMTNPSQCAAMQVKLLEALRATREPYFDVMIEHAAPVQQPSLLTRKMHPDPVAGYLNPLLREAER